MSIRGKSKDHHAVILITEKPGFENSRSPSEKRRGLQAALHCGDGFLG